MALTLNIGNDILGKIYIESRSNPEVKIEGNDAFDDLSPDRHDGPEKNVNMMFQRISKIKTLVIFCSLSKTTKIKMRMMIFIKSSSGT